MDKVYVVTRGEYSDYHIEMVFSTQEAAEKYCAVHQDIYGDPPMIEDWNTSDGTEIECEKVYRAIFFNLDENNQLYPIEMRYSTKPFKLDICKYRQKDNWYIRGISGYIPVDKSIDDEVAKKIIYDSLAKWKAEQAGL